MNDKKKDWSHFSTSLPNKFLKLLRLHAFKLEIPLNDVLEKYQTAYLEKIEREKAEKKATKEAKNGENQEKE